MRNKLPARRPSQTVKTVVTLDGKEHRILLTVGFRDYAMTQPAEVFCSSFKVGTSMNAILSDACVLMSRLFQHGDPPAEIAATLCEPRSVVGAIAEAVANGVRP